MTELTVLRVFVGRDGRGGNPLGVVLDGPAVPEARRQAVAAAVGFSETVFVDDAATGAIRIYTPAAELAFAGHPTVGTSWLLRRLGIGGDVLRPPAGEVAAWQEGELAWVRARPSWIHPIEVVELPDAAAVEALPVDAGPTGSRYAWAWIDEPAGTIRARVFPVRYGIDEDEATGSAALRLCALLGRAIEIRQGHGSVLFAEPVDAETAEVSGRVAFEERREYPL